jgi:hypothetical protein
MLCAAAALARGRFRNYAPLAGLTTKAFGSVVDALSRTLEGAAEGLQSLEERGRRAKHHQALMQHSRRHRTEQRRLATPSPHCPPLRIVSCWKTAGGVQWGKGGEYVCAWPDEYFIYLRCLSLDNCFLKCVAIECYVLHEELLRVRHARRQRGDGR